MEEADPKAIEISEALVTLECPLIRYLYARELSSSVAVLRSIEERLLSNESLNLTAKQLENARVHAILTAINVFRELSPDTNIPYLYELTTATLFSSFFFALGSSSIRYDIQRPNLVALVSRINNQPSGRDLLSTIVGSEFYEFIIEETLRQLDPRDADTFNEFLDGANDLDTLEIPFDAVDSPTFKTCAEAKSIQRLLLEFGITEQVAELAKLLTFERSYLETQPELWHIPKVFDPPYIPWALLFNFNRIAGELCLVFIHKYHPKLFSTLQTKATRESRYIDNPLLIQTLFFHAVELHPHCKQLAEANRASAYDESTRYPLSLTEMTEHPEITEVRSSSDIPLANRGLPIPLLMNNIVAPALRYFDYHYERVSQAIPIPSLLINIYGDLDLILYPQAIATVLNEVWRKVTGLTGTVEWSELFKKFDELIELETMKIVALSNIFWREHVQANRATLVRRKIIPADYDNKQNMLTLHKDRGQKGYIPIARKVTGSGRPHDTISRSPLTRLRAIQISRGNTASGWSKDYKGIHTSDLFSVSVILNSNIRPRNNLGNTAMWIFPWLKFLNTFTHLVYPDLTHLLRHDFQFLQLVLVSPSTVGDDPIARNVCPPFELKIYPASYLPDIRRTHTSFKLASYLLFARTPFLVKHLTDLSQIELTMPAGTFTEMRGILETANSIGEVTSSETLDIPIDTRYTSPRRRDGRFPTLLNALMGKTDLALNLLGLNPPLGVMNTIPQQAPIYRWAPDSYKEKFQKWRKDMERTANGVFKRIFTMRKEIPEERDKLVHILAARAKIQAADRLPPSGRVLIYKHLQEQKVKYTSIEILAATLAAAQVFRNSDLGRLVALQTFSIKSLEALQDNFDEMFKLFTQGHVNLRFFKQMSNIPELKTYLDHIRNIARI